MRINTRNNQKLQKLTDADQYERSPKYYVGNEMRVAHHDEERRQKVTKMLAEKKVRTGHDYYNVALIYQHGATLTDIKKAHTFSKKSMELGYQPAKWLYAATTDRYLVWSGKKQKFGTQYRIISIQERNGKQRKKAVLEPYDKRTTDGVRATFNVPPLKELLKQERVFTKMYS